MARRLSPALLLLSLLAAGCSEPTETFACPGNPVATFTFSGTRTSMTCAAGGPAAGANSLYPATLAPFTGTISYSSAGGGAALCLVRAKAMPLVGTQAADVLDVALDTGGALLSGCSASCAVTVHQQVTGTLQRAPGGAPTGFTGALLDRATLDPSVKGADCTPCTTPCQASYDLVGLPPGP